MPTQAEYKWALKTIEQYEDDLTSNRFISQRQMKAYQKARAIEDEMIDGAEQKAAETD